MYKIIPIDSAHGLPIEITRWHPGKKEDNGRQGLTYQLIEITSRNNAKFGYYVCRSWISEASEILSIPGAMFPKPPATVHVITRASMIILPPPPEGQYLSFFESSNWGDPNVRDVNSGRTTDSKIADNAYFVNVDFKRLEKGKDSN